MVKWGTYLEQVDCLVKTLPSSKVDLNQFYNWIGLEITSWTIAVAKFRCVL